ncbi:AraC family transcriptional regulator [Nocardia brasiliensis]|uniref:AraC family transcriptional regulator n=1 Tax=Nocardia brasiliensis TaxID=37326 RepID=UPI00245897DA|nr:AraC family transcriptional regulator [Nocardia brasiliensis]
MTSEGYELRHESTLWVPMGDRSDFWAERVRRNQGRIGLSFDFGDHRNFNGQTWVQESGDDVTIEFASTEINYRRTKQHIRGDDDRSGRLLVVREGHMALRQNDDVAVLAPGEVALYSMAREMDVAHDDPAKAVVLNIPDSDPIASMLADQPPLKLDAHRPLVDTAVGMVKSLVAHREALTGDNFTQINTYLRQILASSFDDPMGLELSSLERLARDVLAYIEVNSDNPAVTPDSIATHFSCSLSQLHKALRTVETTPAGRLRETRLKRAKRRLEIGTGTVTQIAFDSGFGSASTFRENFRSQYGQYPGEWRTKSGQ